MSPKRRVREARSVGGSSVGNQTNSVYNNVNGATNVNGAAHSVGGYSAQSVGAGQSLGTGMTGKNSRSGTHYALPPRSTTPNSLTRGVPLVHSSVSS